MQHDRARRIITRGPIRVVGIFPSIKCDRTLHWESQLERDRMYHHEIDPHVRTFREQPHTFKVWVDGVLRRYTPDLEVTLHSGAVIIEEIKPATRVSKEANLYRAMASMLEKECVEFRIVTDKEIRRQPYLSNIRYLLPFRHFPISDEAIEDTFIAFQSTTQLPLGALRQNLDKAGKSATTVWALIAHGFLIADLESLLNDDNPIQLNHGALLWHQ